MVGWAAVAPRSELPFARSTKIPHVDDLPVWSVWCIRVRPGHRGKGISHALLEGAVAYAREQGAPAVEGYPVDNQGAKVDLTMAYVGTRGVFERAGFVKAADTDAVSGGFPRVVMRLDLPDQQAQAGPVIAPRAVRSRKAARTAITRVNGRGRGA